MRVKVQSCFAGKGVYKRLVCPNGLHLRIHHESWTRSAAKEALDLLGVEFPHVPRKSVKFEVE